MTRKKWAKMTQSERQLKIAKLCKWNKKFLGYEPDDGHLGRSEERYSHMPDYLHNLNAMHEAELMLSQGMLQDYLSNLLPMMKECENETNEYNWVVRAVRATAAQRAEAFALTMEPEDD